MPQSNRKHNYPAVTAVVVLVCAIGLAGRALRPLIPDEGRNSLASADQDFLQIAAKQDITWRSFNSGTFQEARSRKKPILLLIGSVASFPARLADRIALDDRDLASRINREFIPVRIDAYEFGGWSGAYLPFSRASMGFDPLFQVITLDPRGELLSMGVILDPRTTPGTRWFQGILDASEAAMRNPNAALDNPRYQASDLAMLEMQPEDPDFNQHTRELLNRIPEDLGGIVINNRQFLQPMTWNFLLTQGKFDAVERSVQGVLRSPLIDWIDGGIFVRSSRPTFEFIEFDKLTSLNAEMAALLATLAQTTGNSLYRSHAERIFDWIFTSLAKDGFIRPYQVGDEQSQSRSAHASFSPRTLRDNFTHEEREVLRNELGLRVEMNPQMLPSMRDLDQSDWPKLTALLERMRDVKSEVPREYARHATTEASGFAAARLLEAARRLEDPERLKKASALVDRVGALRSGSSIPRRPADWSDVGISLGDYLGYADAMLQDYITFGRQESLESGLRILKVGLERFEGRQPGVYLAAEPWPSGMPGPVDAPSPVISDGLGESPTAVVVRLLFAYGALQQIGVAPTGPDWGLPGPEAVITRFAGIANAMKVRVSGFYRAAWLARTGRFAITVGPDSQSLARTMESLAPWGLVLPAFGAGEKLGITRPGIYVVAEGRAVGPMSPENAIGVLRGGELPSREE